MGKKELVCKYSWGRGFRRIDGLGKKEGRRSYILYVGGILGEEGIGGLMEWGVNKYLLYVGGILGEEGIVGLMEWRGEEGAILEGGILE